MYPSLGRSSQVPQRRMCACVCVFARRLAICVLREVWVSRVTSAVFFRWVRNLFFFYFLHLRVREYSEMKKWVCWGLDALCLNDHWPDIHWFYHDIQDLYPTKVCKNKDTGYVYSNLEQNLRSERLLTPLIQRDGISKIFVVTWKVWLTSDVKL